MRTHRSPTRGIAHVAHAPLHEGRFGRMFRRLPTLQQRDESLAELAARMHEGIEGPLDNPAIPSGYTYFGQFVDHDITVDPASNFAR